MLDKTDNNAIISGITALGATGMNAAFARKLQQKQMEQDEKFWHMQNEYNSPQAQMKRLQEAGLNPNLIYGQSSGGAAGQATALKSPDYQDSATKIIDPEGAMAAIGGYADYNIKQAQTDNLKVQNQVLQEQAIGEAISNHGKALSNSKLRSEAHILEQSVDAMIQMNREKLISEVANRERSDINAILSRKLTDAQIQNVLSDNAVKQLDARMAKMGLRPQDPFYARALTQLIEKITQKLGYPNPFR